MSNYQQARSLSLPNSYYSGQSTSGQGFKPIGDVASNRFDDDSSKVSNAELPPRPEPPKTPFMCFARYKEEEMMRKSKTSDVKSSDKVRQIAEEWKTITSKEKAHWNEMARQDKIRYDEQRKTYTGWAIPRRRAKKHPLAPKRPMSAFLRFSQTRRSIVKMQNPDMSNTDVSRLLGEMWHNAPDSERNPYIEEEIKERNVYKVDVAKWKAEQSTDRQAKNSPDSVVAENFNPQSTIGSANYIGYPNASIHQQYDFTPEYSVDGWEPYVYYPAHQQTSGTYQRSEGYEPYNTENMIDRSTHMTNCHASYPAVGRNDACVVSTSTNNYVEHNRLHSSSPPRFGNGAVHYYHPTRPHHQNEGMAYRSHESFSRFSRQFMP